MKKMKRALCLGLTFALAVSLPVSGADAKKKKAVKLSKSKLTIAVKAKKKIKVKNAKAKKVVWKVNKKGKKIVKLLKKSKKGVTIKGLKKGKATVSAKITVGKKKPVTKKVRVTVGKKAASSIKVSSVSVLNRRTVQVNLSAAQTLSAANFRVKTKHYQRGTYNRTLTIDSVTTSNRRNYKITLGSESTLYKNEYVQVTVSGLKKTGTQTVETIYSEGTFNYTRVGDVYTSMVNRTVSESFDGYGQGYSTYSVSGLPAGITAKVSDNGEYVTMTGKASKAGMYQVRIIEKDELGNTYNHNVIWLVGSDDVIAAACVPVYGVASAKGTYYVSKRVYAVGGSGSYTYSIEGNSYGLHMDEDDTNYVNGTLSAAGSYNIRVRVTDKNNTSRSAVANLPLSIVMGRTISGVVKDKRGQALADVMVEFENKNKANLYYSEDYVYTDEKGAYSIQLVNGTYDAWAFGYNTAGPINSVTVSTTRSGVDFVLPLYSIAVVCSNPKVDASRFGTWYDDRGKSYGSGNRIYLKEGSYRLHSSYSFAMSEGEAVINVAVNSATRTATATITLQSALAGTITEEQPLQLTLSSAEKFYTFVPKNTGTYYFYSEGSYDTMGALYSDSYSRLSYNDDSGENSNFLISYDCTAGQTYYISIESYSSGVGYPATLHATRTRPSTGSEE